MITTERIAFLRNGNHGPGIADLLSELERLQADERRLNFLEGFINTNGGIVLHEGNGSRLPYPGIGLRPGFLNRSLRTAIDQCEGIRK